MKIVRTGKKFIVTKGMEELGIFYSFDTARAFMASNGVKTAQEKLSTKPFRSRKNKEDFISYKCFLVDRSMSGRAKWTSN